MENEQTENLVASHGSVAFWDDVFECIRSIMDKEPAVHFMDGHQMNGKEGWKAALLRVRSELSLLAAKSPSNTMVIKQLPWMCGNCGETAVQNLRKCGEQSLEAKCDICGAEWVS